MAVCSVQNLLNNASGFTSLSSGEIDVLELQLLCEILNAGGGGGGGGVTFKSTTIAVPAAASTVQTAHGLGRAPQYLYAVWQCIANDAASGFNAGAEINALSLYSTANPFQPFAIWADATNINLSGVVNFAVGGLRMIGPSGGVVVQFTSLSNFQFKFYFA